jgi:hypothetical protein
MTHDPRCDRIVDYNDFRKPSCAGGKIKTWRAADELNCGFHSRQIHRALRARRTGRDNLRDVCDHGSAARAGIAISASAASASIRDLQHLIACTLAPSQRASARWRMGPYGMTISRWCPSFLVTVAGRVEDAIGLPSCRRFRHRVASVEYGLAIAVHVGRAKRIRSRSAGPSPEFVVLF